jgi:hypothetical protein
MCHVPAHDDQTSFQRAGLTMLDSDQQRARLLLDRQPYRFTRLGILVFTVYSAVVAILVVAMLTKAGLLFFLTMLAFCCSAAAALNSKVDAWIREKLFRPPGPNDKPTSPRRFRFGSYVQCARRWMAYGLIVGGLSSYLIFLGGRGDRWKRYSGQILLGLGTNLAVVASALFVNGYFAYRRRFNELQRGAMVVMEQIVRHVTPDLPTVLVALSDFRRGFGHPDAKNVDGIIDPDFELVAAALLTPENRASILLPLATDVLRKMGMDQKPDPKWFAAKAARIARNRAQITGKCRAILQRARPRLGSSGSRRPRRSDGTSATDSEAVPQRQDPQQPRLSAARNVGSE